MPKQKKPETFNEHLGAVIAGRMRELGLTQEEVVNDLGWNPTTFGRRIRGSHSLLTEELVVLAKLLKTTPDEITEGALANFGGVGKLMSVVPGTTNDLDTKRKQNEARAMTIEQIEKTKHAATRDPEMDTPEPD